MVSRAKKPDRKLFDTVPRTDDVEIPFVRKNATTSGGDLAAEVETGGTAKGGGSNKNVKLVPQKSSLKPSEKKANGMQKTVGFVTPPNPFAMLKVHSEMDCYCGANYDIGGVMCIQCDKCNQWSHMHCVGLEKRKGKKGGGLPKKFYCMTCKPRLIAMTVAEARHFIEKEAADWVAEFADDTESKDADSTAGTSK